MLSNLSKMGRRAFTLVELIIVIVIVGILAAISIVGYQAVVDRAEEQAVKTSLESVDREFRALAAFGIADGTPVDVEDMTSFSQLTFESAAGVALDAGDPAVDGDGDTLTAGDKAKWDNGAGVEATLTFGGATQAGTIVID